MRLLCDTETRLGKTSADEIKSHHFFEGIDFDPLNGLRKQPAPFVPKISHPTDTSNFDAIDPDRLNGSADGNANGGEGRHHNLFEDYVNGDRVEHNGKSPDHAFFEFTFRRFFDDGGQAYPIRIGLGSLLNGDLDGHVAMPSPGENAQGSPVYV